MDPKIIILDVSKNVREVESVIHSIGHLRQTPQEIFRTLTECVRDPNACYTNVLNFVGKIKHSQHYSTPEAKLNKLGMAIGDLGMAMIGALELARIYQDDNILRYHFHAMTGKAIALRREDRL
jgi:hypothetical protein